MCRHPLAKRVCYALFGLLPLLVLCAIADAQPIGSVATPLTTGGLSVGTGEATKLGLVGIITRPNQPTGVACSGVLMTNLLVLTAGHCIDALTGSPTVVSSADGSTVITMRALYKFGVGSQDTTGPDIGLIQLSSPMPNAGFTNRFFTRLNRTDPTGQSVTVYGRSTGVYLKAVSTVQQVTGPGGRNLLLQPGSSGATTTFGDSGGPTFLFSGGQTLLVGINSAVGGTIAAINPHVGWLIAASQNFLDQTRPFASTTTLAEEIQALPEGGSFAGGATGVGPNWPAIQRIVTLMCTKRGFLGGTLIPDFSKQDGARTFACIGRSGGTLISAIPPQIIAAGGAFGDLGSLPWASGARAAADACSKVPNTIGGFLDGSAATSSSFIPGVSLGPAGTGSPISVPKPATGFGILCLNASAGRFFDVDPAQLKQIGAANLDTVGWVPARVDAASWCRGFGFAGGFANGNQVPGKRGIVCIGAESVEQGGFGGTTAAVFARPRALYALNIDSPLVAPAGATTDVGLTFATCHTLLASSTCPVVPAYVQWSYDPLAHRLIHAASGKCVNLSGANVTPAALIILFPCVGANNEKWSIVSPPGVTQWRLKSDLSGLCLTALPGTFEHGSGGPLARVIAATPGKLVQRSCDGSAAQTFDSVDRSFAVTHGPR